jgi:hypothetical protein
MYASDDLGEAFHEYPGDTAETALRVSLRATARSIVSDRCEQCGTGLVSESIRDLAWRTAPFPGARDGGTPTGRLHGDSGSGADVDDRPLAPPQPVIGTEPGTNACTRVPGFLP